MLSRHPLQFGALTAACLFSAGCADTSPLKGLLEAVAAARNAETGAFMKSFQQYRQRAPYKALVLARGDSNWAWGWAANDPTMNQAIHSASEHCENSRVRQHIKPPCRLYAVDDDVVADYTRVALKQLLARYASVNPDSLP